MAANHSMKLGDKVRESLEMAQARLASLEEEAQRVMSASRKEVANLLQRLSGPELFENAAVKEWSGKARHVGEDFAHRIEEMRDRVVTFVGVASREQVDDLARDLEKLARKIDKALGAAPQAKRPAREAKKA